MKNYFVIALFLFSCQSLDESLVENSLVVEAYLFENKTVENIKLSLVNPIDGQSELITVSNARVYIGWNNIFYELFENNNTGLYSSNDENLQIISGENYELRIDYNNDVYRAETRVPLTPSQLTTSKDTLNLNASTDFIKMTWENPDSLWYLGVIAEEDPSATDFPFNNFFSVPSKSSEIKITPNNLDYIGDRQFILFGITDDYQDLYRISNSTIGSSNAGNLSLGFGIFAAFSSDTVNFVVVNK